jgi:hypothetical protein
VHISATHLIFQTNRSNIRINIKSDLFSKKVTQIVSGFTSKSMGKPILKEIHRHHPESLQLFKRRGVSSVYYH